MVYLYTYISHTNQPNVGKYIIHGWYGRHENCQVLKPEKHITPRCAEFMDHFANIFQLKKRPHEQGEM